MWNEGIWRCPCRYLDILMNFDLKVDNGTENWSVQSVISLNFF